MLCTVKILVLKFQYLASFLMYFVCINSNLQYLISYNYFFFFSGVESTSVPNCISAPVPVPSTPGPISSTPGPVSSTPGPSSSLHASLYLSPDPPSSHYMYTVQDDLKKSSSLVSSSSSSQFKTTSVHLRYCTCIHCIYAYKTYCVRH